MGLGSWSIAALAMEILMQKKKKNVTSSCFTWDVKTDRSQQLGEAMYFIDMLFQTQLIG